MLGKPFARLMQKEMSRREFLAFLGAAILAAVGISSVMRNMSSLTGDRTADPETRSYGGGRGNGLFR